MFVAVVVLLILKLKEESILGHEVIIYGKNILNI